MRTLFEKKSVKIIAIILALLFSLSFYLWGVSLTDNYYWIYNSRFFTDSIMCKLSLDGMKAWFSVFGFTLLSSRMLAWILNVSSVLIPYLFLLKKEERKIYVYYLCVALIIMGPGIAKCCTPDCFTASMLSILMVVFIKFIQRNHKFVFGLLLCISTALLIAIRFPNIVVVPFVAIFMVLMMDEKAKWQYAIGYMVLSLVIYWLVMTLLLGDTNCISLLGDAFAKESGNSNGRHSLMGLFLRYCKSILLALIALFSIIIACITRTRLFYRRQKLGFIIAIVVGTFLSYSILGRIGEKFHSWPVCITPIVSLPLLYVVYYAFKNKDYTNAWLCLFLGLVIFIPSAGSDTGFQKSLMSACGIIPIAVVKYINVHKKMLYINIALGIMFSTSVFMYSDNLCNNNAVSSDKKLWGVFLNKRQLEHNQMIKEDLKPYYRTNHTVFYGLEAHYWYFYTDTKPLYNPGFWMLKNDKSALYNAIASLKRDPNNVFIDFTKSDTNYFIKKGIRPVVETDSYNIYKY